MRPYVFMLMIAAFAAGASAQQARETFVPSGVSRPASVELRAEATIEGEEVRLRQIARWGEFDAQALEQTRDVVVYRFSGGSVVASIDVDQVKAALEHVGVKLAAIQFCGPLTCTVRRIDTRLTQAAEQAVQTRVQELMPATRPATATFTPPPGDVASTASGIRTLREVLLSDLTDRLGIPRDRLVVQFKPSDDRLLNLAEPLFRFTVTPRQRRVGDVTWDVILATDAGQQKAAIAANVRVWQNQVITAKGVAFKQIFTEADLGERRILVDQIDTEGNLTKEQVVGQQAGRDIGPGTVLNSHIIQPVQLIRMNQLITVTVERGGVRLKWIAEAREPGSAGQTIRVRRPNTREEFMVVVTGPEDARLTLGGSSAGTNVALR